MKYELYEVRSGGQTGADIAGVMAARVCGIPTGGWLPKGWTTQEGPKPQYGRIFNMKEHYAKAYPPRTYANVRDADATMRFASDFNSAGEKCTLKAIKEYGKPHFDVFYNYKPKVDPDYFDDPTPLAAAQWIRDGGFRRLNIAGNAKSTSPSIGLFAFDYLTRVFQHLGHPILEEMVDYHRYVVLRLSSPNG